MMEAEREDGQNKIHCLEEELAETRNNSAERVVETSFDVRYQITEMEDKVYAKFDKAEETRGSIRQQAKKMLA